MGLLLPSGSAPFEELLLDEPAPEESSGEASMCAELASRTPKLVTQSLTRGVKPMPEAIPCKWVGRVPGCYLAIMHEHGPPQRSTGQVSLCITGIVVAPTWGGGWA